MERFGLVIAAMGLQYDLLEYPEGHCLPGGRAPFSCQNDVGFEAGQEIIDFYIAHPKS